MGSWGAGAFANDDAMDLVGEMLDSDDDEREAMIISALHLGGDYLEVSDVSAGVAAAALVALKVDGIEPENVTVARWLETSTFTVTPELRRLAEAALERALAPGDNEWYELWDEAGELEEVIADVERYQLALED